MQRDNSDDSEESQRSRPSSRRSSVSLARARSLKRDKDRTTSASPASTQSTPKRNARPSLDLMVTGKQILKRADRANSLPGSSRRREGATGATGGAGGGAGGGAAGAAGAGGGERSRRIPERRETASPETELHSLDLSQISDFDENKPPLATSTPKPIDKDVNHTQSDVNRSTSVTSNHSSTGDGNKSTPVDGNKSTQDNDTRSTTRHKTRSASLQHIQQRVERRATTQQSVDLSRSQRSDLSSARSNASVELPTGRQPAGRAGGAGQGKSSRESTFSCSRDSLFKTSSSASPYRCGTEQWPASPGWSLSSAELSPREPSPVLSSCCSHSWERTLELQARGGCAACGGAGGGGAQGGEWSSFWADYGRGYDRCPTPYRELDVGEELADSHSPSLQTLSELVLSEGLALSGPESRRALQCARQLARVLARAVERAHARDRCTLTLNLKREAPCVPKVASNEVTTQTDISLPNTKSAPRIFENILRQLSRSSIDEPDVKAEGQSEK